MEQIRTIGEAQKKLGDYLKLNWIFASWKDKIALLIILALAVWKLIEIVMALL